MTSTTAPAASPRRALRAAERAFAAGKYRKALARLPRLRARHRLWRRAALLGAYAHFKLGEHQAAAHRLDAMARRAALAGDAALLRAMVAVALTDWPRAQREVDAVLDGGDVALERPARAIQRRIDAERQRKLEAKRAAEVARLAAERAERAERYRAAIKQTKAHIKRGRLRRAEATLARAEALRAGDVETRYYRGYLAFRRGRYAEARRHLRAAIAIDPRDAWSRYMLALAIDGAGETKRATRILGGLARKGDREVRQVARRALQRIERRAEPGPRASDSRLTARLELGSGVDSNPAYLDETPVGEAAVALQASARLGYRRPVGRPLALEAGVSLIERAYVAGGGQNAHHTEPRAHVGLELANRRARLSARYGYGLVLYDHRALLSSHVSELAGWLRLVGDGRAATLDAGLAGWGGARMVHDAEYRYFEALRAGASAQLRLSFSRLQLQLGYAVARDWADPVVTTFAQSGMGDGTGVGRGDGTGRPGSRQSTPGEPQAGTEVIYQTTYQTDYSQLEHGPDLALTLRLPWRLRASASVGLRWRRFDRGDTATRSDTATSVTTTERLDPRRDLRLAATVELQRDLPAGLALALRLQSLDNWSSVESIDLDRNYRRRVAELALRWTWQ